MGNLPINQSLEADTEPLLKLCLLYRVLAAKYFMVFQVLVSQKNSEKYFFYVNEKTQVQPGFFFFFLFIYFRGWGVGSNKGTI